MDRKRIILFSVILLTLFLFLFISFHLRTIIAPFLFAYVLQFVLIPFVNFLESRGISHSPSVIIVFAGTFLSIALILSIITPAFISEITNIQDNLDEYSKVINMKVEEMRESLFEESGLISKIIEENPDLVEEVRGYFHESLMVFIQRISKNIFNLISLTLLFSVIPFATFFFLYDSHVIKKWIVNLAPNQYFEISLNIIHSLHVKFGLILKGMLVSVVIISLLSSAGLWIIRLEYPVLVGIFAGIANLIPYFGPVAGTVAAFCVAIVTGAPPVFFLYILLVFLIVNLIDNTLVQPIVMSRVSNLHPLLIIFLVIAGSKVGGIIGMLLAVPVISLIMVIVNLLTQEFKRPIRPDFKSFVDIT